MAEASEVIGISVSYYAMALDQAKIRIGREFR